MTTTNPKRRLYAQLARIAKSAHGSTMDELAAWTLEVDRTLVFRSGSSSSLLTRPMVALRQIAVAAAPRRT